MPHQTWEIMELEVWLAGKIHELFILHVLLAILFVLVRIQLSSCPIWVCLKIVYPEKTNGFADHYPYTRWLFHWGYTPFSDIPISSQ